MATIKVHLMLFPGFPAGHIELALECDGALYSMDRWDAAYPCWLSKDEDYGAYQAVDWVQGTGNEFNWAAIEKHAGNSLLKSQYDDIQKWMADTKDTTLTFEIEADPNDIVRRWENYQKKMKDKTSTLDENCAEAMRRFLNQFAGCTIQKIGAISFPWDVYDAAKVQRAMNTKGVVPTDNASEYEKEVFKEITTMEDKVKQKEAFLKHNLLVVSGFYDQLSELAEHAERLDKRGYLDEAGELRTLVGNFKEKSKIYRDGGSYEEFQKTCQELISETVVTTEQIRSHRNVNHILGNILLGILGLGIFYGIACAINKVVTGKATFFSKTKSMHRAAKVVKSVCKVTDNSLDLNDDSSQSSAGPSVG